jgi:hypothetical protein
LACKQTGNPTSIFASLYAVLVPNQMKYFETVLIALLKTDARIQSTVWLSRFRDHERRDLPGARAALENGLKLDPGSDLLAREAMDLLLPRGRVEDARKVFSPCGGRWPAPLLNWLADLSEWDRAPKGVDPLTAVPDRDPRLAPHAAFAHLERGDKAGARSLIDAILPAWPERSPEWLFILMEAYGAGSSPRTWRRNSASWF